MRFALPENLALRASLAIAAAMGTLLLVSRSFLYASAPNIPYGVFPDVRPVLVLGLVGGLALLGAAFQGARSAALWTVVLLVLVFELDHATVHWFSSFPGTLAGARLDPVRLAGGVVALAAVLLLHADVHAAETRVDLARRGVPKEEAESAAMALVGLARRRVAVLAGGALVGAAVVVGADAAFGETTLGPGEAGLLGGAAVLVALALVLLVRRPSGLLEEPVVERDDGDVVG